MLKYIPHKEERKSLLSSHKIKITPTKKKTAVNANRVNIIVTNLGETLITNFDLSN